MPAKQQKGREQTWQLQPKDTVALMLGYFPNAFRGVSACVPIVCTIADSDVITLPLSREMSRRYPKCFKWSAQRSKPWTKVRNATAMQ